MGSESIGALIGLPAGFAHSFADLQREGYDASPLY